jgi:hypothetical protein
MLLVATYHCMHLLHSLLLLTASKTVGCFTAAAASAAAAAAGGLMAATSMIGSTWKTYRRHRRPHQLAMM